MHVLYIQFPFFFPGPTTWWFFFPDHCDDLLFPYQSPVALDEADAVATASIDAPRFNNYHKNTDFTFANDGAILEAKVESSSENEDFPYVEGGPLIKGRSYRLDSVEWHWGESDEEGAEHVVDGKRWVLGNSNNLTNTILKKLFHFLPVPRF